MPSSVPAHAISPGDVGQRLLAAAVKSETSVTDLADRIGVLRPKLYAVFNGEIHARIGWLYAGPTAWVREVLADIAAAHGLLVVARHAADDTVNALRWLQRLAGACGTTVSDVARIFADERVDATEGAHLEKLGEALVAEGQALIALGRTAQRERVVALPVRK